MRDKMIEKLRALHRDEQGADMVEYILIVAAVALPLLAVIIWFWKDNCNKSYLTLVRRFQW